MPNITIHSVIGSPYGRAPPDGEAVKLPMTHSMDREGSKFIGAVSGGWPQILSNLKSPLETGSVILPPMEFSK
jgi:hypothetical protein